MSSHPNVVLMAVLTPDDGSRKTFRAMAEAAGAEISEGSYQQKIGKQDFSVMVMEEDYEEDLQIQGGEGNIVAYDMVTYGYGEVVTWAELNELRESLEEWAKNACERYSCKYEIKVTANYW